MPRTRNITQDIRLGHRPDNMKKWKRWAHKKERNHVRRMIKRQRWDEINHLRPWLTNNLLD